METADVYIDSGARQCQYTGHPLVHTEQKLVGLGIDVLASHCGQLTGVMFPAVCGGRTEKINIHTIDAANLAQAESAGYKALTRLAQGSDPGYQVVKCDKRGVNLSRDI